MQKQVVTAKPSVTLREACEVMSKLHIGSLVIMEENRITGIITSTDVLKAIARGENPDKTTLSEIMSRNVITIAPDERIEKAVEIMMEKKIKRLPVVENDKLIGIVTASDIIVVEPKLIRGIASLLSLKLPGYRGG
jgi:CBS domain-containing protein